MTPERKKEIEIMSLPGMQEKFRERMGDSKERDHFHCMTCGSNFTKHQDDCNCNDYESERWIICPLPIDPDNPERGLWGMVDWGIWKCEVTVAGRLKMSCGYTLHIEDYPTLALLLALAHQWGIEP